MGRPHQRDGTSHIGGIGRSDVEFDLGMVSVAATGVRHPITTEQGSGEGNSNRSSGTTAGCSDAL